MDEEVCIFMPKRKSCFLERIMPQFQKTMPPFPKQFLDSQKKTPFNLNYKGACKSM